MVKLKYVQVVFMFGCCKCARKWTTDIGLIDLSWLHAHIQIDCYSTLFIPLVGLLVVVHVVVISQFLLHFSIFHWLLYEGSSIFYNFTLVPLEFPTSKSDTLSCFLLYRFTFSNVCSLNNILIWCNCNHLESYFPLFYMILFMVEKNAIVFSNFYFAFLFALEFFQFFFFKNKLVANKGVIFIYVFMKIFWTL